jgi:hypothetical protein
MSAMPRCLGTCLLAAAALLVLPATAEVSIGKTYSGDVSLFATLVLSSSFQHTPAIQLSTSHRVTASSATSTQQ